MKLKRFTCKKEKGNTRQRGNTSGESGARSDVSVQTVDHAACGRHGSAVFLRYLAVMAKSGRNDFITKHRAQEARNKFIAWGKALRFSILST